MDLKFDLITDISPDWRGSTAAERQALDMILQVEGTPNAIIVFWQLHRQLGNYWYWFTLGTLWVSYSGFSDLNLWRRLFSYRRPRRQTSLMKPSELTGFERLPDTITAYRAHRPNETDWISYTIDQELAERWAVQRGGYVRAYKLQKADCLALFLRRGESEILMLDPARAEREAETE